MRGKQDYEGEGGCRGEKLIKKIIVILICRLML